MIPIIFVGLAFAFFTILIFLMRKPFLLSNRIVIFFMMSLSLPMITKLNLLGVINLPSGKLDIFKAFPLLFGPFLYFYTKSEIIERPYFKKKYWFNFVPFLIAVIFITLFFKVDSKINHDPMMIKPASEMTNPLIGKMPDQKLQGGEIRISGIPGPAGAIPPRRADNRGAVNTTSAKFLSLSIIVSFFIYLLLIIKLLRVHEKKITDYFSYDSLQINLKWLKWITICFFLSYGFVITIVLFAPTFIRHQILDPRFAPDLGTTFFIFTFSLFAIKQPVIFKVENVEGILNDEVDDESDLIRKDRKYKKSGLKDNEADIFLKSLEEYMRLEKPFLDPDLSIVNISEKLNIPKHYLTEIINRMMDKNFYTYINEFRVDEVKQKIADESYREHSIIRIAYDSGFNSKSVFNRIFKQITSLTPTEYRQQYLTK